MYAVKVTAIGESGLEMGVGICDIIGFVFLFRANICNPALQEWRGIDLENNILYEDKHQTKKKEHKEQQVVWLSISPVLTPKRQVMEEDSLRMSRSYRYNHQHCLVAVWRCWVQT